MQVDNQTMGLFIIYLFSYRNISWQERWGDIQWNCIEIWSPEGYSARYIGWAECAERRKKNKNFRSIGLFSNLA